MGADRIHEALTAADAVILTASHEPGQPPLIDRAALAATRPGARLVNIVRGALIDEAALLEALDQERRAGAGLDVFTHEPYPASGPLAHHPNLSRRPPNALNAPTQPRQIPREHRADGAGPD